MAFLLLGGSATVAVADPGRSHSDRGSSSDRGNSNSNSNGRGGSDRDDEDRAGNHNSGRRDGESGGADKGAVETPQVRFGSGRIDAADVAELAPSIAANLGDPGSNGPSASGSASSRTTLRQLAPGGAADRGGSDRAGAPDARFSPPRVTVGNGRTPGIQRRDVAPQWQAPAPQPAPAAPPPPPPPAPAPPPSWVHRIPTPPVLTQQRGTPGPADWSDPLWGLAGLLLIPAAGAVLGYRQARAAHAAEKLRRS
jgi:hypothetical protein